jgi:hypothetical protein
MMNTMIRAFHGENTPCNAAAGCLNKVEGSTERTLSVEKEKANWATNTAE